MVGVAAHATEGGLPIYPDGLENFISGALPPPGVHFLLYGGVVNYDKLRDNNGNEFIPGPPGSASFKARAYVVAPRAVWVTGTQLLGGQLAFHAVAPLLNVKVDVAGLSGKSSGLGDMTVGAALGYHASQSLHYVAAVDVFLPTGKYNKNELVNLGKNYVTVQPVFAISQIDPAGLNVDMKLMYDINMNNSDTNFKSGQALHADYAIGWGFGAWAAGVGGYAFIQTTSDTGLGATTPGPGASSGKGRAYAIGPSVRFFDGKGVLVTAKLQKEFNVRNRPEGTQFFVKATMPF